MKTLWKAYLMHFPNNLPNINLLQSSFPYSNLPYNLPNIILPKWTSQQQPPQYQPSHQLPQQRIREQSLERDPQMGPLHTPSLPSLNLSSFSSPKLFKGRSQVKSEVRLPSQSTMHKSTRRKAKSSSPDISNEQIKKAAALCSVEPEATGDFQLRKALKPQLDLEKIHKKKTFNLVSFRSASMVTTFVRSAGEHTRGV